jgi:2-polyprenyl-3-methyl-5-hydroxy-6-metoxy-1,4-benzoquinol methylase
MLLEEVNCDLCDSEEQEYFFSQNGYNVVRCRSCGLLYVNPRPDVNEIRRSVRSGSHSQDVRRYTQNPRSWLEWGIQFYELVFPYVRTAGQWLDIGCASGFLLQAAELEGWRTVGIELNQARAAIARVNVKGKIFNRSLETFDPDDKFDVISMLNVFSHLPHPKKFLMLIHSHLKSDGILLIQTGNFGDARKFTDGKHSWNLPGHLYFATRENLGRYLAETGFEVLERKWLSLAAYRCQKHSLLSPNTKSRWKTIIKKVSYYMGLNGRIAYLILKLKTFNNPCGSLIFVARRLHHSVRQRG